MADLENDPFDLAGLKKKLGRDETNSSTMPQSDEVSDIVNQASASPPVVNEPRKYDSPSLATPTDFSLAYPSSSFNDNTVSPEFRNPKMTTDQIEALISGKNSTDALAPISDKDQLESDVTRLQLKDESDKMDVANNAPIPGPRSLSGAPESSSSGPSTMQKLLSDYAASRKQGQDELAQAQQGRNYQQLLAGLGQASATVGSALGYQGAPTAQATNFWQGLGKQAEQGVTDVQQRNQQKLEDQFNQLKVIQVADAMAAQDPNSNVSKAARAFTLKIDPTADVKGKTAAELQPFQDNLLKIKHYQMLQQEHQERTAAMKEASQAKISANATKAQAAVARDVDRSLAAARTPGAILQENDIYNAQKVMDIKNDPKIGGDLNKIKTNMIPVAIGELAKIAQGGVPHKDQLDRMMPPGVMQWIANNKGKVLNEAQAAQAKGFLQDYFDYVERIQKSAQKTVLDRYGRILDTNKNRMHPDDYSIRRDTWMNRFKNATPETSQKSTSQSSNPTDTITIRRISDGVTKTLDANTAKKYLTDSAFEQVKND